MDAAQRGEYAFTRSVAIRYFAASIATFFDIIKQRDHKYALPSPLTAVEAVKTPVGAVAKNFN